MLEDSVVGAFSEEHAAKLSGISLNQLRAWDRVGFFKPSFGVAKKGIPFGRIYSFRDIVSLRILNDLRNNIRCSLQHLKEVSGKLSHLGDAKWTSTTLHVLGKRVVVGHGKTKEEIVSGQKVLDIPLRVVIANTRKAVAELNNRKASIGQIVRSKFVSQNEFVIAGTRITVASIRDFDNAGYSPRQIVNQYPSLTIADVHAALEYQPRLRAA